MKARCNTCDVETPFDESPDAVAFCPKHDPCSSAEFYCYFCEGPGGTDCLCQTFNRMQVRKDTLRQVQ
jgi:hypothetical protein